MGLVLLLWLAISAGRIYPNQESFFNELAGNWTNWSKILVDSNLDWGQDLPALRQVMEERGIERVNLAYFGKGVPERYGVQYAPLPGYLRFIEGVELNAYNPYTPEPGWYAISATSLRLGLMQTESVDLYAYFRDLVPDARAGYSIYLYEVRDQPELPVDRIAVVGSKVSEMTPDALGIQAERRTQVKWLRSPEATIYPLGEGFSLPTEADFHPVDANFDGVFSLMGYTLPEASVQPGEDLDIELYWSVGEKPMPMPAPTKGEPLSAFVHLTTDKADEIESQFDGWRTALRGLEAGDIIVQRVQLSIEDDIPPGSYTLRVGLYSPQTFGRLPVVTPEGQFDHVELGNLVVQ
ncbi:MAG: hypothetical protein HC802_13155 [Caldilineaceae bacterium]|nr:hypothetical protein [Caldilineaceae bacterium]